MGSSTSRRTLPVLAVASVALTAACGIRPPLAPAADSSPATASAEVGQVDPEHFLDDVRAGIGESTSAEVRTDVDTEALTMTSAGVLDWTTSPVTADFRLDVSSSPGWSDGEVRVVDGVMYLRYGKVRRFVSVDLSAMGSLPPELTRVLDLIDPLAGSRTLRRPRPGSGAPAPRRSSTTGSTATTWWWTAHGWTP